MRIPAGTGRFLSGPFKKAIEAITNLIWLHNHILGGNLHDFRVAHGTENM